MSLSERRACSIVGADRTIIRYRANRPADAALRGRLRDLANERRRFGYRRLALPHPQHRRRRQGMPDPNPETSISGRREAHELTESSRDAASQE
ncbi:hypothetical protein ACVIYL_008956 [Bradyrhizobium sp. USDA 3315]